MTNLGIMASQISGHLFAPAGAYDSIATTTLSTATASITFSSIPATYSHLQIRAISRNSTAATSDNWALLEINGDTTATNYYMHSLRGNGTAAQAEVYNGPRTFLALNDSNTANVFSGTVIDILDYANTNKYKTIRVLSGWDSNGDGDVRITSNLWKNTAAVSSIILKSNTNNFMQYSSFALYGIK